MEFSKGPDGTDIALAEGVISQDSSDESEEKRKSDSEEEEIITAEIQVQSE